jgi:hypothetical protein
MNSPAGRLVLNSIIVFKIQKKLIMKKNLLLRAAELGLFLFAAGNLHAQSMVKEDTSAKYFSTPVSANAYNDYSTLAGIKEKSERTFSNFTRTFKNAENISYSVSEGRMIIHCRIDGDQHLILYSKRGHWLQTIRTFNYEKLSEEIQDQVTSFFPKFKLFGVVNEIKLGGDTAYLIRIENKKSWKILRLANGELDVFESYVK